MMIFLLFVAVPLILIYLLQSRLSMDALLETVSAQTHGLLEQIAQNVEKELNNASVLAAVLMYDQDMNDSANHWALSPPGPQRVEAGWKMTQRLQSIFTISNRVGAIALYMKDGTVLTSSNYPNIRSFAFADKTAYREAKAKPNQVVIADSLSGVTDNGGDQFILSAIICPQKNDAGRAIDAILVMSRVPYLDQFTNFPGRENEAGLIILGRDGASLLSDRSRVDKKAWEAIRTLAPGNSELSVLGRTFLVNTRTLDMAHWTFLLAIDKASISNRILAYQRYFYPALALMLGLFLIYSMVFFSRVTKPIGAVMDNMRRFAAGLDPLPVHRQTIQELAALNENFDHMVAEIRRLDVERQRQSERRLEAEIRALQFQISPHFIANTLNSIRMMALAARNDAIRDMTQALIRILADSYASAEPLTSLANEIANLKNYLLIMKMRFGEHFRVSYELDPETLDAGILRMSLQPLVENAILHGFADLNRRGELTIRSRRTGEDTWLVQVCDNGVGMEDDLCQSLLAPDQSETDGQAPEGRVSFNRIGLRNVQERIHLNFGDPFGLAIESRPGEGTTVHLTLPFRKKA
jgi:two-component system sensor histidine kinase YesM